MFANATNEGLEESTDRLGGFSPIETDAYPTKIKIAYAGKSAGGANNISFVFELEGGREYRETVYYTNKKGENFFLNKDDKTKKVPLPGFNTVDDICLVATGQPLSEQDTEEKMVQIWDNDAKKEVPKSVPVLTGLVGQTVGLAINNSLVNKNQKVGNEYVPTAETKNENTIDKVFDIESQMTVAEAREGRDAGFIAAWVEKNKGNVRDKRTYSDNDNQSGRAGRPAGGAPAAGAPAAGKSLFGARKTT